MRVAILNVVESGHNAINAFKRFLPEGEEVVFSQNLFTGKVDLNKETLKRAVDKVDEALAAAFSGTGAEKIYVVLTGPYVLAFTVLQRIMRAASGVPVVIAQWDMASRKYLFFSIDELSDILYKPFLSGE